MAPPGWSPTPPSPPTAATTVPPRRRHGHGRQPQPVPGEGQAAGQPRRGTLPRGSSLTQHSLRTASQTGGEVCKRVFSIAHYVAIDTLYRPSWPATTTRRSTRRPWGTRPPRPRPPHQGGIPEPFRPLDINEIEVIDARKRQHHQGHDGGKGGFTRRKWWWEKAVLNEQLNAV